MASTQRPHTAQWCVVRGFGRSHLLHHRVGGGVALSSACAHTTAWLRSTHSKAVTDNLQPGCALCAHNHASRSRSTLLQSTRKGEVPHLDADVARGAGRRHDAHDIVEQDVAAHPGCGKAMDCLLKRCCSLPERLLQDDIINAA
jgi:hypothetical protein